jgi:hypothetical protein
MALNSAMNAAANSNMGLLSHLRARTLVKAQRFRMVSSRGENAFVARLRASRRTSLREME